MRRPLYLAALIVVPTILTGCGSSPAAKTVSCAYPTSGPAAKAVAAPRSSALASGDATATLVTDRGTIGLTLERTSTPCTVNSFVSLAQQHYFDHTRCHRLTTTGIYVLQCGDPTGSGTGGPGYSFDDELTAAAAPPSCSTSSCVYPAGTVAMANAGANTNGSQFFLVYQDSPLAYHYTVFGHMSASGLKVVQQFAAHGAGSPDSYGNTPPNESVTITKVTAR